ncbi:hypothetical protein F442_00983 [Phytophthora nicotianae P10297]|uniref:Uncharacterized protein n=2 Tax=Phytophthora nicotianae TaxID=4792 RepID=W3A4X3_PHYNI|nr:hypothetical protein F444_01038 [Phytophthora nicotianae P1976]ETP54211.1 hypothetical protein F442_00983 [Phytophthora nicotianae P10297]
MTCMFMPYNPTVTAQKFYDVRLKDCVLPQCRFELYAGKRNDGKEESAFDKKTGAVAVVRNLKVTLGKRVVLRRPGQKLVLARRPTGSFISAQMTATTEVKVTTRRKAAMSELRIR